MADIREKIKKLLSLATSANENEARDALLKAKELMAKNKLSEDDFEEAKAGIVHNMYNNVKWTTDSGKIWMATLCRVLAENYCCVSSWGTPRGTRTHVLMLSGCKDDVELCGSAIEYAVEFICSKVKILKRRYPRQSDRTIESSYANGFICGLEIAFEEQKEEHPEWGLVVVKSEELRDWEDTLSTRNVTTKATPMDALAYMSGQTDGMKFNMRKIIGTT